MKKVKIKTTIKNLRNKPIKDGVSRVFLKVGDFMANQLAVATKFAPLEVLRALETAKAIESAAGQGKAFIELEDADFELLRKAVEQNAAGDAVLFQAQVLKALNEAE